MVSHRFGFEVDVSRSAGPNTLIRTRPVNASPVRDYVVAGVAALRDVENIHGICVEGMILAADVGLSDIPGPWEEILEVRTTDASPNVRPDMGDLMVSFGIVDLRQWSKPAHPDESDETPDDGSGLGRVSGFS